MPSKYKFLITTCLASLLELVTTLGLMVHFAALQVSDPMRHGGTVSGAHYATCSDIWSCAEQVCEAVQNSTSVVSIKLNHATNCHKQFDFHDMIESSLFQVPEIALVISIGLHVIFFIVTLIINKYQMHNICYGVIYASMKILILAATITTLIETQLESTSYPLASNMGLLAVQLSVILAVISEIIYGSVACGYFAGNRESGSYVSINLDE